MLQLHSCLMRLKVQCFGSNIFFTDLVKSNKRCPNAIISSDLEYFLLLVGHFSVPSANLHNLWICASHYQSLIAARRCAKCELCKTLFGKPKACVKRQQLRPVNKLQAISIWLCRQLAVYNHWVCDSCRKMIARNFVTEETMDRAERMFQRLYNENDDIVRTPSTATKSFVDDDDDYCPSLEAHSPSIQRNTLVDFRRMLRESGFSGKVQSSSYSKATLKYQRDYRMRTKKIFLHLARLLVLDEYEELWEDMAEDEYRKKDFPDNKCI